ncbi:MAG: indole-3-glycerol-phosphate synthase [Halobacteriaceae archaeon]
MGTDAQVDPAVAAILASARERPAPGGRVDVDARSLPDAFAAGEADGRVPVIAEIKPTSPTTAGRRDDDPAALAREMVAGGAAALSVLTEPEHFGGSPDALRAVRDAVDVPVLRKDFLLDPAEFDRVAADVVLVIARFVDDLPGMVAAARERGFQVLVEVHTPAELTEALAAGATLVGVNNRDLASLTVDRSTFGDVVETLPGALATARERAGATAGDAAAGAGTAGADRVADGREDLTLIAESGVETPAHVRRLRADGADGLLIGTAIMDGDVRETTRRLCQSETNT